jgi:hypothetical protein
MKTCIVMVSTVLALGCATLDEAPQEAVEVRYRRLVEQDVKVGVEIEYLSLVRDERYAALTNQVSGEGMGFVRRERLCADTEWEEYLRLRRAEWRSLAEQIALIDRMSLRLLSPGDPPPNLREGTQATR